MIKEELPKIPEDLRHQLLGFVDDAPRFDRLSQHLETCPIIIEADGFQVSIYNKTELVELKNKLKGLVDEKQSTA